MTKETHVETGSSPSTKHVVMVIVLCSLLGLYVYRHYSPAWRVPGLQPNRSLSTIIETEGDIPNPGVYFFDHSPTVDETLAATGERPNDLRPKLPNADDNLASGTLVRISKTGQAIAISLSQMEAGKRILFGLPLNLNTAQGEELSCVPGIGPRTSLEIVAYRNQHGYFSKIDDLINVKGIGIKKFGKISKYLVVAAEIP